MSLGYQEKVSNEAVRTRRINTGCKSQREALIRVRLKVLQSDGPPRFHIRPLSLRVVENHTKRMAMS